MDFLGRKKVSLKMSYTIMDTLPLPVKSPESKDELRIARLAASLALAGEEMARYVDKFSKEDPGWNRALLTLDDDRRQAKAEIESLYASKILGLDRRELEFILSPKLISEEYSEYETFGALERSEIRQFGEFRTRRLILEAWDSLIEGRP